MDAEADKRTDAAHRSRSFAYLNATQFFGALNDNVFRFLLTYFLIVQVGVEKTGDVVIVMGLLFVIPFLLFSHRGGVLADTYSKQRVIVICKICEVAIMGLGTLGFYLQSSSIGYTTLFLMSTQSAIFGPAKFGTIPELVDQDRLSKANSLIVMFTFVAIVIGVPFAAALGTALDGRYVQASIACILIATMGLISSFRIERTPAGKKPETKEVFFLINIFRTLREISEDRHLLLAVVGSAFFMLLGACVQISLLPFGLEELGWNKENSTYLALPVAVGIGAGSIFAGILSGRSIEFGIVPLGAMGMAIALFLLDGVVSWLPHEGGWLIEDIYVIRAMAITPAAMGVSACLLLFGMSAGLFLVPLNSFIQYRVERERLGRVLAANAFMSFSGVFLAPVLLKLLSLAGLMPSGALLCMGGLTIGLTLLSIRVLPDFLFRFVGLVIIRIFYRITLRGGENLPPRGAALLVCNHVMHIDALLINATTQRRIRFLMYRGYYEKSRIKWLLDLMQVVPISVVDGPKEMLRALKKARDWLDEGYIVCVFPEGGLTRNGNMRPFMSGFERIMKGAEYPVIPAYIHGAWGSIFSYYTGASCATAPSRIGYPITMTYGKPLPSDISAFEAREAVQELGAEAASSGARKRRSLFYYFVRSARKHRRNRALMDSTGANRTYGETLIASLVLGAALKETLRGNREVGVLMPASVAGTTINLALVSLRHVPVNLNFTASREAVDHAVAACGIRYVITSRAFLEKIGGMEHSAEWLYVEDLASSLTPLNKLSAGLKAWAWPVGLLAPRTKEAGDALATVIFSSGSTGMPKGVMLTHHNVISNVESLGAVLELTSDDNICSALPLFHSFGFTCAIWYPLLYGFSASYHPNPLEGSVIAELVRTHRSTMLLSTPTFLLGYIRRAKPEDFESLRVVIVGAEKMKPRIADSFEKKFGIRPLEGYGATELAPVVACNIPDVVVNGMHQTGVKEGTIGHPLPTIAVRVEDVDTGQKLSPGQEGVLMVKGPNVMAGYLQQEEKTKEVLRDGWYNTGDIGKVDEDGFITITDRLSRFSKIAGEMVSHVAVEDVYMNALRTTEQVVAVTSVADDRKGERLIVLCLRDRVDISRLLEIMGDADVPNLWKPRRESYLEINELPVLGTGKLDLQGIRALAQKQLALTTD